VNPLVSAPADQSVAGTVRHAINTDRISFLDRRPICSSTRASLGRRLIRKQTMHLASRCALLPQISLLCLTGIIACERLPGQRDGATTRRRCQAAGWPGSRLPGAGWSEHFPRLPAPIRRHPPGWAGCWVRSKIRTAVSSPVASHTGTDIAPTWQRLLEHVRVPRRAERATLAAIDTATGW